MDIFVAVVHHLLAFGVFTILVYEHLVFKPSLSVAEAKTLQRMDLIYGIAAVLLVAVGFLRVFFYEKGAAYYFGNVFFWAKIIAFVVVGLVSIYPTTVFLSWSKALKNNQPAAITERQKKLVPMMIRLELLGIVAIIVFAVLMAR